MITSIIAIILIISIGVKMSNNSNEQQDVNFTYILTGESENWILNDYKFIVNSLENMTVKGSGEAYYKGDVNEIQINSVYLERYDPYFRNGKEKHGTHGLSYDSTNNNFLMGGSGGSPLKEELTLAIDDLRKVYFLMYWKTQDGKELNERINVSIE